MGETTKIQWADATWNPFMGCTKVSPACDNCYAERWAKRYKRDFNKVQRARFGTFKAPKVWPKAKRIFVCSLSDFFHPDIVRADRHQAIKVMRDAPQHTYMLLTKRPENIIPQLAGTAWEERLPGNVWVGVTAENQEQANKRIPILLQVPAAVRFVSCEPMLGPVDIVKGIHGGNFSGEPKGKIDWVICGGESGKNPRPIDPFWVRKLRDQCKAMGCKFFFKQWGEWIKKFYKDDIRQWENTILDGERWNLIPGTERSCRVCGCTEDIACAGGCSWVKADLCSACAGGELK